MVKLRDVAARDLAPNDNQLRRFFGTNTMSESSGLCPFASLNEDEVALRETHAERNVESMPGPTLNIE